MYSINDISIAVNGLFLDIIDNITLGLNKTNFLKKYANTQFRQENSINFEFSINPVFRFDDKESLIKFLNKEKALALRHQDDSNIKDIEEMIIDINDALTLEGFYLNYSIETNQTEAIVVFKTNSPSFKYEVIG